MHRSDFNWSVLTLLGVLLASAGCRSQRADGHVQISPGPQTFSKQVEPPASRLAGGPTTEGARRVDPAAPAVGQRDAAGDLVLVGTEVPASKSAGAAAPATAGEKSLSDSERAALMEAFRDASPEIRALAEQRIAAHQARQAASSAVTAEQPAQPAAPESAPAGTPATKNTPADTTAAVADAAAQEEGLPSLEDSRTPAAAPADGEKTASAAGDAADATKVAKEEGTDAEAVDIRRAVGEGEAENQGEVKTVAATNSPAAGADSQASDSGASDPLAAASNEQLFQQLIIRYKKRLQDETRGESLTGDLVTLRTLTTLAGNPDSAVTPVEGWNPSEQEFLNYQMLALWQLVDPQAHPVRGRRWTMALPELRQATNHLAAATGNLEVRGMSFCTEVESYGRIKPFSADRFTAGQQVILYSELENFVAERLSDGYETHLRGTYEIFDASGQRIADQVLPEDRQICNNYRRDYFIAYEMYLPNRLAPGKYRLELTMEDVKGKKYGQGSIPLEITK